jgi:hypothetical protein
VAYKDHPKYAKYFKMLAMGLPIGQVKHALARDGLSEDIADKDPNESVPEQKLINVREYPKYIPYFKMLKMGLPLEAVKHKVYISIIYI